MRNPWDASPVSSDVDCADRQQVSPFEVIRRSSNLLETTNDGVVVAADPLKVVT
jgi:hypothetical protein